jgi:hypothetical protein
MLNTKTISKPYRTRSDKMLEVVFVDDETGRRYRKEVRDMGWATKDEVDAWLSAQNVLESRPLAADVHLPEGGTPPPDVPPLFYKPFLEECESIPEQDADIQEKREFADPQMEEIVKKLLDGQNEIRAKLAMPVLTIDDITSTAEA